MADWTDQDVNDLLPGEPWTSAKANAAFENPPAIAEGAADAPRNYLGSLERLNSGNLVRASFPNVTASPFAATEILLSSFFQGGDITLFATRSSSSTEFTVNRTRGGSITTLILELDASLNNVVSVIPGDIIRVIATGGSGTVSDISLRTGGADLWPTPELMGLLVNNRALT